MYNSGIGTPYWFEWEIGILECLNMLQDTSIESVILQSTDFQALDDVVVNYSDKSILNIQVKHTDEDANFTYSFLASGKKPLLNELALECKNNKDNYNFKGIQIVTNKKWGPQETDGKCSMDDFISKVFPCLQDNYNYTSAKPNEQKTNFISYLSQMNIGCSWGVYQSVHILFPVRQRKSDILSFFQLYSDIAFPIPVSEQF